MNRMKKFDLEVNGDRLNGFQALSFEDVIKIFFDGLFELGNPIFHGFNIVDKNQKVVGSIREVA